MGSARIGLWSALVLLSGCDLGLDVVEPCATLAAPAGDGACTRVGPSCPEGFDDGAHGGCEERLPEEHCDGLWSRPGEPICGQSVACLAGDYFVPAVWAEFRRHHVDPGYAGSDSDGSMERPWRFIQTAADEVSASDAPGTITLRIGATFRENLVLGGETYVVGGCGVDTTIVGQDPNRPVVEMTPGATVALATSTITGPGSGIEVTDAIVELADLRILDVNGPGILARGGTMLFEDSVVDGARDAGIRLEGVLATIKKSVVRRTRPMADGTSGRGIDAKPRGTSAEPSELEMLRTTVEGNREFGILVEGSTASIEEVVVRDTDARERDGSKAAGIAIRDDEPRALPAEATVRSSVVARTAGIGILVRNSDVTLDNVSVRETQDATEGGHGVQAEATATARTSLALVRSHIEAGGDSGVTLVGAQATLTECIIRDPRSSTAVGLAVRSLPSLPGSLEVQRSRIENARTGISAGSAQVTLDRSVLDCNAQPLEALSSQTFTFAEPSLCGCEDSWALCTDRNVTEERMR